MAEETPTSGDENGIDSEADSGIGGGPEEAVTEQQFLRAATAFEAIILSQIDIKNKLGDRLNYSIQAGIIILGIIAASIFILLLTLSSQVNRISGVVKEMNQDFTSVRAQMERIDGYFGSIEQRVTQLEKISGNTVQMEQELGLIARDLKAINGTIGSIKNHVGSVRGNMGNVSVAIDRMNHDIQLMSVDMHRMGGPARSMNKMFPFP
jgi:methyl-accepting chemotaxis protein